MISLHIHLNCELLGNVQQNYLDTISKLFPNNVSLKQSIFYGLSSFTDIIMYLYHKQIQMKKVCSKMLSYWTRKENKFCASKDFLVHKGEWIKRSSVGDRVIVIFKSF